MIQILKDGSTELNPSRPKKGSEIVVKWQTLTESLYEAVYTLNLQGKNSAFSPLTSNGAIPDPNLEATRADANASQSQAVLQVVSANLKTTADMLESMNKIHGENAKQLSEQQSGLMEINATLARLTAGVISLEESK